MEELRRLVRRLTSAYRNTVLTEKFTQEEKGYFFRFRAINDILRDLQTGGKQLGRDVLEKTELLL